MRLRNSIGGAALLAGAILCFEGCAEQAGLNARTAAPAERFSPGMVIEGVPFIAQEEETCGPSSLAMVLGFFGHDTSVNDIINETRSPGLQGTLITDLANAARKRGFKAEIAELDPDRLRRAISQGGPVVLLVDLGAWIWSRPHYLVAFGWTPEGVVAHSGHERGQLISWSALDAEWQKMNRLALIVRRAP